VEDAIIMDDSKIINAGKIVESLIGRNVKIRESAALPKGNRLIVGDNSDISL
jgi:glucose-1-phosphate thymidylyltransferase